MFSSFNAPLYAIPCVCVNERFVRVFNVNADLIL